MINILETIGNVQPIKIKPYLLRLVRVHDRDSSLLSPVIGLHFSFGLAFCFGSQSYAGSCGDAPGNKYFDPVILHTNTFVKTKGFCTDIFFNQAIKWMESQKGKKPFFAYDILPTVADIVGGSPKDWSQLHGLSLVSLLKDAEAPWEDRYRVFHQGPTKTRR